MTTRIIIILGTSPGLGSLYFWEFALALLTPAPSTYCGSIFKQRKGLIKEGFPSVLLGENEGSLLWKSLSPELYVIYNHLQHFKDVL